MTTGTWMLLHQPLGFLEGGREFLGLAHADRLAAHRLGDRDMVDAVAGFRIAGAALMLSKARLTSKSMAKPRCAWRIRPR